MKSHLTGIYKLYWDSNEYFYYGHSCDIGRRFSQHKETMRKGKHHNPNMQRAYNHSGEPKIEVVELCSMEVLDSREQYYLSLHIKNELCCNLQPSATSSKGYKHSDQTRERNRLGHIGIAVGEKNPFYGRVHTEETKDKISKSRIGKKFPKLSEAMMGRMVTEETRKKMSEKRKYGGTHKAKTVLDTLTGVFYSCAQEVADLYHINSYTLRARLNGYRVNNTQWVYC